MENYRSKISSLGNSSVGLRRLVRGWETGEEEYIVVVSEFGLRKSGLKGGKLESRMSRLVLSKQQA